FFSDITGSKYSWDTCLHIFIGWYVSFFIYNAKLFKWLAEWNHTNINENTVCFKFGFFTSLHIFHGDRTSLSILFVNCLDYCIPNEFRFIICKCSVLDNFLSAWLITPLNDRYLLSN